LLYLLLKGLPSRDFALQEFPEFFYTPVLPVGAFLVAERRDLRGLRPYPYLLYPLLNLLQVFMELRHILCLVTLHLLECSQDLTYLLLYERRHVPAKRHKCYLLLCKVATHLAQPSGLLDEAELQFLLCFLHGSLRGVELIYQVGPELLQIMLVLSALGRQLVVAPLDLVCLVTYYGGQGFVLLLCLTQSPQQLITVC